jgi:hypothetical protein
MYKRSLTEKGEEGVGEEPRRESLDLYKLFNTLDAKSLSATHREEDLERERKGR